jgi:Methylase involved in ubiquinone/menaquinone biosynthesis
MLNDYDKYAKQRQEQLQKGNSKPHRFVEKPMMLDMLPNLKNKKILLLGCGTGEETKMLESFEATDMIGIDLSEESIKIARDTYPQYEFSVGDMHRLPFEDGSFDFVYSSLVLHYSENPVSVCEEVYRILKKGGEFLFSVGHPMRWSSEKVVIGGVPLRLIGHTDGENEQVVYGNYHTFALHEHSFVDSNPLAFYTGSPSMHFKLLKRCGFSIEDFTESKCVEEARDVDADYYNRYSEIPQFMAFLARK